MTDQTNIDPADLLAALMTKTKRGDRRGNLEKIFDICKVQAGGSRDFAISSIGKLLEISGGLRARALYNASSADYRTLITCWANWSGTVAQISPPSKPKPSISWIQKIEDPAARTLVTALAIERDRLLAEVNLLRSQTILNIRITPQGHQYDESAKEPIGSNPSIIERLLTSSEIDALESAISEKCVENEGWRLGPGGSILHSSGRTIFHPGFRGGISKILARERG